MRQAGATALRLDYTEPSASGLTLEDFNKHIHLAAKGSVKLEYLDLDYRGQDSCDGALELLHAANAEGITVFKLPTWDFLLKFDPKDACRFLREFDRLNITMEFLDIQADFRETQKNQDPKSLMEIVRTAGQAGFGDIRFSNISFNTLVKPDIHYWTEIAKIAGKSGIRAIYFSDLDMYEGATIDDFMHLISTAGQSGIKKVYLKLSDLEQTLDFKSIIKITKLAGESGIRDFAFSNWKSCDYSIADVVDMIKVA